MELVKDKIYRVGQSVGKFIKQVNTYGVFECISNCSIFEVRLSDTVICEYNPEYDKMINYLEEKYGNCGLNADWNCRAYYIGYDHYVLDSELNSVYIVAYNKSVTLPIQYDIIKFDELLKFINRICGHDTSMLQKVRKLNESHYSFFHTITEKESINLEEYSKNRELKFVDLGNKTVSINGKVFGLFSNAMVYLRKFPRKDIN